MAQKEEALAIATPMQQLGQRECRVPKEQECVDVVVVFCIFSQSYLEIIVS